MSTITRGKRGPYAKTAETKATIARAALEVVREKGHRALTTAEVSERAGVSEATRFYHFPTRDHLLVAAMTAAEADNEAYLNKVAREPGVGLDAVPALLARRGMTSVNELRLFNSLSGEAPDPDHPAHDFLIADNSGHWSADRARCAGKARAQSGIGSKTQAEAGRECRAGSGRGCIHCARAAARFSRACWHAPRNAPRVRGRTDRGQAPAAG